MPFTFTKDLKDNAKITTKKILKDGDLQSG